MSDIEAQTIAYARDTMLPPAPPPTREAGAVRWLRANLLSGPFNVVLTAVAVLRPLYAEIAHKRFGPAGVTKNSFFAAVLGHTISDLHTSLSYMDYHLPNEDGADEGDAGTRRAADGVTDRLLRQSRAVGLDPG